MGDFVLMLYLSTWKPSSEEYLLFCSRSGEYSDCMLIICLLAKILPLILFFLTGLSLYFEEGHDDLDDCEYSGVL